MEANLVVMWVHFFLFRLLISLLIIIQEYICTFLRYADSFFIFIKLKNFLLFILYLIYYILIYFRLVHCKAQKSDSFL